MLRLYPLTTVSCQRAQRGMLGKRANEKCVATKNATTGVLRRVRQDRCIRFATVAGIITREYRKNRGLPTIAGSVM